MDKFMDRILRTLAAFVAALVLAGCSALGLGTGSETDNTAGWSAQKLYNEAREEMSAGSYDKAIKYFETLEARYPFGRFAQQAQIEVAYAHHRNNDPTSALAAADRFIKLHPSHPNLDYVYYLKGVINFNDDLGLLGRWIKPDLTERDQRAAREAFDSYKEVVTRFPESKYAKDAAVRMNYLVNAIAMNEIHVARYYMKRGAFLAAANRAQSVVKGFQQTPAVEEALFIMVKAYDALGIDDLRDDAERVMRKNFPNSVYYSGGPAGKPWWRFW
jgi:outer membrane protein assembly factor BamD